MFIVSRTMSSPAGSAGTSLVWLARQRHPAQPRRGDVQLTRGCRHAARAIQGQSARRYRNRGRRICAGVRHQRIRIAAYQKRTHTRAGRDHLRTVAAHARSAAERRRAGSLSHDLVTWDNRCTMHRGTDYDNLRRTRDMQRATACDIANSCAQEGIAVGA